MPPDKPARPTSTDRDLGRVAEYRAQAFQLLKDYNYVSLSSLARVLGCSYWTVYSWWKHDPAFADAFKASRQAAIDDLKENALERAQGLNGQRPSDLMSIYMMNNFDEEIIERTSKQRAEITIRLEVPALSASGDSWAAEVAKALPDAAVEAQYREILNVPKEPT